MGVLTPIVIQNNPTNVSAGDVFRFLAAIASQWGAAHGGCKEQAGEKDGKGGDFRSQPVVFHPEWGDSR